MQGTTLEADAPAQAPSSHVAYPPYPPYPPCVFRSHEEKQLYRRLKAIYEQHSPTWDQESRDAWPWLVERASLKPTTTKKVTSHLITKSLRNDEDSITWGHIVVLRVIFKQGLFASRKMMKIIRRKYPSANLNTFSFHEDYKREIVANTWAASASSKKMVPSIDTDEEGRDDSPSEVSEKSPSVKDDQNEKNKNIKETNTSLLSSPPTKKEKITGAKVKQEGRETSPQESQFDMPAHPADEGASSSPVANKRKRPASQAYNNDNDDNDNDDDQGIKPKTPAKKSPGNSRTRKVAEEIGFFRKIKVEGEIGAPAKRTRTTRVSRKQATINNHAEMEDKGAEYREIMEEVAKIVESVKQLSKELDQSVEALERKMQNLARPGDKAQNKA